VAFLIFERAILEGRPILRYTGEHFKLAGYNLLHRAWKKLGKPINKGWRVTRAELIELHFSPRSPRDDVRMIIDWNPTNESTVSLFELIEIYAYTWGNGGAEWTPFMLKGHSIPEQEYETPAQKMELMKAIPYDSEGPEFVEFLYLKGDDYGWNWGRSGMTNAAFLDGGAREFFKTFF
jgi:hypothetical protein